MRPLVLFMFMFLLTMFACVNLCGYLCVWCMPVHAPAGNTHSASLLTGLGAWSCDNVTSVSITDLTTPQQSGQLESGWKCLLYDCRDLVGSGKIAILSLAIVHTASGLQESQLHQETRYYPEQEQLFCFAAVFWFQENSCPSCRVNLGTTT